MFRRLLAAAVLLTVSGPTARSDWPTVAGWRLPTPKELGGTWRNRSPHRFAVARGDFDGDGRPDEARIMVSTDGQRAALVVALSQGGPIVIALAEQVAVVFQTMGIEVLPAGKHRTACGKGYSDCQAGEPEVLELRWDGIDYFQDESAASVFFLPERGKAFRRIWLSD